MGKRINKDAIDHFQDYGIHTPTRTLYIGSESYDPEAGESGVDGLLAERHIKNLLILDSVSQDPITIILNNPGGDVYHGMAIYDAIRACKSHVTVRGTGYVMSMASLIIQAADERQMTENAIMMLHHGYDNHPSNHVKTIRSWADFGKRYDARLNKIYLAKIREKYPEFKYKKLDQMLDFDTQLFPEDALQLGLIDKIYCKNED
jgi:ATP-dependent protease ClpP protease subunit